MGDPRGEVAEFRGPAAPRSAAQKPAGRVSPDRQVLQYLFYIPTRAVSDPHRAPVPLGQGRLVGVGEGRAGSHPHLALSSTLPWILKSLMSLISAFLSPVYLLEILFSLLKRRLCAPSGVCRGGSGFYNSAVSSTTLGNEKRKEQD